MVTNPTEFIVSYYDDGPIYLEHYDGCRETLEFDGDTLADLIALAEHHTCLVVIDEITTPALTEYL